MPLRDRRRVAAVPRERLAVRVVAICEPYADAAKGPLARPRRAHNVERHMCR